jgi:hypothetical protein
MVKEPPVDSRTLRTEVMTCDLAVIGGGLAGLCCAITAARAGIKVILIHDRPVLGGNASSEVRLWILGATSHMGNNNRWAREGGVIDEILVENLYRNPEGNPLILDALLLEMAVKESNLQLLLNAAVFEVAKDGPDRIRSVRAFCSQNSTLYDVKAPLFCDASGDGVVGFLAGAAFRIGAESRSEFGEAFAPEQANSELLGHTIYFYSKDVGRPVEYVAPSFALKDISQIPRFRQFNAKDIGCRLWWIEWGGKLDTIHESENIKWELWKVVYGVWDHIKNSGQFPEAANLTLEWVGTIPGKRESRRFEGDYMLTQDDLVKQVKHPDAVSFGGWAIDLHPADGVYSPQEGCTQWHTKGVYGIPYRCFYSRNIENLFLAGRIISASHVAFGSTRVMATCAHGGQAVGMAASLCIEKNLSPRELGKVHLLDLKNRLMRSGQFIPQMALRDPEDLTLKARLECSSELSLGRLAEDGSSRVLEFAGGMMLPVKAGPAPAVTYYADVAKNTTLKARLLISTNPNNHTPDCELGQTSIPLEAGVNQPVRLAFDAQIPSDCYAFYVLEANPAVSLHLSKQRLTGVLSVWQKFNRAVAKSARQEPPDGIGIDAFDFWLPERRPEGKNLACQIEPPLQVFSVDNLRNGIDRPTSQVNAWVADFAAEEAEIHLAWDKPQKIRRIELVFDSDLDHPMESVLMGHPERVSPFCVREIELYDGDGRLLDRLVDNHRTQRVIELSPPVDTAKLTLRLRKPNDLAPIALLACRCYV